MPMLARWHFCFVPAHMTIDACYKIGFVMKPHGLKGQVTISLDPEAPVDFDSIDTVFLEQNERLLPYFIENISLKGNRAFLKLEEVDTPEEAGRIARSSIYLPKTARPKSGRGEFYDDEVIGFEVEDSKEGVLGTVAEIVRAGGNRLLSVTSEAREVLIPLNGPFIDGVNKTRKRISVTLPDGFLDL